MKNIRLDIGDMLFKTMQSVMTAEDWKSPLFCCVNDMFSNDDSLPQVRDAVFDYHSWNSIK